MSVSLLDLQPEAPPIGLELRVQGVDVRTDHLRRITELAVPVRPVVLQIAAHRGFGVMTEGDPIFLVEAPNGADGVGDEVRVANVVYARIVDPRVVQGRLKTRAARG